MNICCKKGRKKKKIERKEGGREEKIKRPREGGRKVLSWKSYSLRTAAAMAS